VTRQCLRRDSCRCVDIAVDPEGGVDGKSTSCDRLLRTIAQSHGRPPHVRLAREHRLSDQFEQRSSREGDGSGGDGIARRHVPAHGA